MVAVFMLGRVSQSFVTLSSGGRKARQLLVPYMIPVTDGSPAEPVPQAVTERLEIASQIHKGKDDDTPNFWAVDDAIPAGDEEPTRWFLEYSANQRLR